MPTCVDTCRHVSTRAEMSTRAGMSTRAEMSTCRMHVGMPDAGGDVDIQQKCRMPDVDKRVKCRHVDMPNAEEDVDIQQRRSGIVSVGRILQGWLNHGGRGDQAATQRSAKQLKHQTSDPAKHGTSKQREKGQRHYYYEYC